MIFYKTFYTWVKYDSIIKLFQDYKSLLTHDKSRQRIKM